MIKFILKLAIAALVANAMWRVGSAYANFYRFEDAVHQAAQFRGRKSDEDLRRRVLELAMEYDVPVTDDDVTMRKELNHLIIDASYVRPIDVVPGYTYRWPFSTHVDIFVDN